MKMDKLKKDDIQLEKVVSELKERLKYKDELNLDLIQRNRELKAKLRLQLSLKSELTEKELLLTVGLESLLLLKKHRYNHIKKEEDWLLLYDAINILYGDISHIVSSFGRRIRHRRERGPVHDHRRAGRRGRSMWRAG